MLSVTILSAVICQNSYADSGWTEAQKKSVQTDCVKTAKLDSGVKADTGCACFIDNISNVVSYEDFTSDKASANNIGYAGLKCGIDYKSE